MEEIEKTIEGVYDLGWMDGSPEGEVFVPFAPDAFVPTELYESYRAGYEDAKESYR